jgi:type I restriction enzyme, R subunit
MRCFASSPHCGINQPADSFVRDLHPDLKADYILANPPFNVSDWSGHCRGNTRRPALSAAEGERVAQHARTKARRKALARRFKNPEDDLRLVIVCDMWLTGFDCPPLHTMYLDKPLAGHNLMQAIARVNRVFGEKPGGVVVDFLGIADQLRDAVQTYTQAGGEGSPVRKIQDEAVPLMEREYEALGGFFHGFDYRAFVGGSEADQVRAVTAGVDYVLQQHDGKRRFMTMVAGLSKAFVLSVPRDETQAIRDHLAYFQSIRAAIHKRLADDGPPPSPDARAAVRQVISGAIASDGVIDLFQAAGLADPNVGILSEDFLDRLAALPHRNLALETLRKLLNDQIRTRERVNIVQSPNMRHHAPLMRHLDPPTAARRVSGGPCSRPSARPGGSLAGWRPPEHPADSHI